MTASLPITAAETALDGFRLPHRRQEDWRWTDLRQLIDQPYPPIHGGALDESLLAKDPLAEFAGHRFVFVNGALVTAELPPFAELSHEPKPSSARPDHRDEVAELNDRFAREALRLTIKGEVKEPILVTFISNPDAPATVSARLQVHVEAGASAILLETHIGNDRAYLANSLTEVILGEGAKLERIKINEDSLQSLHVASLHAELGKASMLRDFTLTQGSRVTRQQGFVTFRGEDANGSLNGAYLLNDKQHADTKLTIDHAVPNCISRELFKCVMDDHARGIFQGKVIVRKHAQKTDGKQSSNALLLSEMAEFDAKPELEIFADDVVCGHGATSGSINEDHLFYLRARGVPEAEAKSMLIAAFAAEAFDDISHEGVRNALAGLTASWLVKRKG